MPKKRRFSNRKRLPREERRDIRVQVVLSPIERKKCEALARARNVTLSAVLRSSLEIPNNE